MSAPQSHGPQRAPRDLGTLIAHVMSRGERGLEEQLAGHRREDEARAAAAAASPAPEPEDEGLAFLRRLREAGL